MYHFVISQHTECPVRKRPSGLKGKRTTKLEGQKVSHDINYQVTDQGMAPVMKSCAGECRDIFGAYPLQPASGSRHRTVYSVICRRLEADYKVFKPGELSDALKEALGIQPGFPPPWLLNQQRTGTPPSYPTLRIPGLNAPLPPGANWGFSPGQ